MTDPHAVIALARECGGKPLIREPFNSWCKTTFSYEGLDDYFGSPVRAAEAYLQKFHPDKSVN